MGEFTTGNRTTSTGLPVITAECQSEDRGCNAEVIYSGFDQDYDSRDSGENRADWDRRGLKWQRTERPASEHHVEPE